MQFDISLSGGVAIIENYTPNMIGTWLKAVDRDEAQKKGLETF